jgi:hypothetical protein
LSDEDKRYINASDAALELQILKISGIPVGKYSNHLLDKAYVRVLLEDDTFVTDFGTKTLDGDTIEITWNKPLYFKLSNPQRDPSHYQIFLMICLNTEQEISFID